MNNSQPSAVDQGSETDLENSGGTTLVFTFKTFSSAPCPFLSSALPHERTDGRLRLPTRRLVNEKSWKMTFTLELLRARSEACRGGWRQTVGGAPVVRSSSLRWKSWKEASSMSEHPKAFLQPWVNEWPCAEVTAANTKLQILATKKYNNFQK